MSPKLPIGKFNLTKIARDAVVLILGQRNSGKSLLMEDIMYCHRDIPNGIVISGTEHVSPFFNSFFPDTFIYNDYDSGIIHSMLKTQVAKKKRVDNRRVSENDTLLLLDDCVGQDNIWRKDQNLKEVFVNGRHYQIMTIMASQYPMVIPPVHRNQADYIFIYKEDVLATRKKLHDFYAGVIPTFQLFDAIMRKVCQDWTALVIDRRNKSSVHWTQRVFYYKAKIRESFRFGDAAFWAYHEKHIKDKNEDNELVRTQRLLDRYGLSSKQWKITMVDSDDENEEAAAA
jgi:hypothetical protein